MVKILGKDPEQDQMIFALQEAIEQVKAGRVRAMGVVLALDGGPAHVIGGTNAATLYIGAALMMDEIKERCKASAEEQIDKAVSSIIIPARKRQ